MSLRVLLLLSLLVTTRSGPARAETPVAPAPAELAPAAPAVPPQAAAATPAVAPPASAPPSVPIQYECTSFPVRSTMAMGAFQAPSDVSNARLNPTRLPVGWTPMAGSVGEGGAFVIACRPVGS